MSDNVLAMETVKAVFIDATNRSVTDVDIVPCLDTYYQMLNCDCVQVVSLRHEGDVDEIMVDESGALKPIEHYFSVEPHWPGLLIGNALILGPPDQNGDEQDCKLRAAELNVTFGTVEDEDGD